MPRGGARPNPGPKKGSKQKATILKEQFVAQQFDQARREGRELPTSVIERIMALCEGAAGRHRPVSPGDVAAAASRGLVLQPQAGDWQLFGQWVDRVFSCAKELAKYREPPIRAVDAPAPPPDPGALREQGIRRITLRVFEGGKPVDGAA